jgi:hypothetical protein
MSDRIGGIRLNRRRLLAAISTVGATGALTGRGAAAYLTDRETLADNRMTAGTVTLALDDLDTRQVDLDFTVDDYGFENRATQTVCLGLDDESNPAWVWIRACPLGAIANALDARLTVGGETVYTGSLGGLLDFLSGADGGGVLLTELTGDGDPLTPGVDGAVCLTVAVWAPTTLTDDPGAVRALKAASPFAVTVDAYAEQSRHVPTPRRPVTGSNPSFTFPLCEPTGGGEGGEDDDGDGYAISNISLCTPTPVDPDAVTWTVRDPETDADVTGNVDEAFVVTVTSPVPVDSAVVKAGTDFRSFDADGATTVTVSSTGGTLLDVPQDFARCACDGEGFKLDDWSEAAGTFDAVVAFSCADDAVDTGERSGGPPARGPPGPTADEPTGSVAPETNGGGNAPPNGDER